MYIYVVYSDNRAELTNIINYGIKLMYYFITVWQLS